MGFLIDLVNFLDFSLKLLKFMTFCMTIQVSKSDSGLFRFIHDCGHPVHAGLRELQI